MNPRPELLTRITRFNELIIKLYQAESSRSQTSTYVTYDDLRNKQTCNRVIDTYITYSRRDLSALPRIYLSYIFLFYFFLFFYSWTFHYTRISVYVFYCIFFYVADLYFLISFYCYSYY